MEEIKMVEVLTGMHQSTIEELVRKLNLLIVSNNAYRELIGESERRTKEAERLYGELKDAIGAGFLNKDRHEYIIRSAKQIRKGYLQDPLERLELRRLKDSIRRLAKKGMPTLRPIYQNILDDHKANESKRKKKCK
jgi:hypothetical protein